MPVAFDDLIPATTEKKSVSFDDLVPEKKPVAFDDLIPQAQQTAYVPAELQQADEQQAIERDAATGGAPQPLKDFAEFIHRPLVSPEQIKTVMPYAYVADAAKRAFPDSTTAQVAAGVTGGMTDAVSSFTSPENLALLGVAPEGKIAQRLVAGTFLGQAIAGTPEQWKAFNDAPELTDKIRIATAMGLGYALPLAGMKGHAMAGEVPKTEANETFRAERDQSWPAPLSGTSPQEPLPRPVVEASSIADQSRFQSPQPEITTDGKTGQAPSDNPAMARFQPQPDPIVAAALKTQDGQVFSGQTHSEAAQEVRNALTSEQKSDPMFQEHGVLPLADDGGGFVTASGRYVTRDELAKETGKPVGDWLQLPKVSDTELGKTSVRQASSVPSATEANSDPGKPNETVSITERPIGDSAPTGETLGGSNETPSSAPGPATGAEPVRAAVDETPARVNDDPFLSRIANRFSQERAARGEMGDVAPGQGYNTEDIVSRGLKMSPEEVNQHVSDIMRDQGNDPMAQGAAVRAEEARLSDRSTELSRVSEANPTNLAARQAANAAFQDLTDFHNGPVAKLKQRFHASGMALQGEIPVDLSTFNGLREKWLKDNGKAPPASMEPTFRRTAENVRRVTAEENATVSRLGQEIEKATRGKKLPSAEEVRLRIAERMKDLPCRV